jgi:hypothetical protein
MGSGGNRSMTKAKYKVITGISVGDKNYGAGDTVELENKVGEHLVAKGAVEPKPKKGPAK